MVILLDKKWAGVIEKKLCDFGYMRAGDGSFVACRHHALEYPVFRLRAQIDELQHNLLLTLTMETYPEHRLLKGKDLVIYHRGTFIEEELARIKDRLALVLQNS